MRKEFSYPETTGLGKILLLTDFSGASYYIANFALHFASVFEPHILDVLNIYSLSDFQLLLDPFNNDHAKEQQQKFLMNQLKQYLREQVECEREVRYIQTTSHKDSKDQDGHGELHNKVHIEMLVEEGDLVALTQYHARRHGLIIMGTQGMNFTLKRAFGSGARKIMSKICGSLVLIVPIPEQKMENGILVWEDVTVSWNWINSMEKFVFRKIVYLVDGIISEENKILSDALMRIAKTQGAEIIFVHVDTQITNKRVSKFSSVNKILNSELKEWSKDEIRIHLLKEEWKEFKQQQSSTVGDYSKVKYVLLERKEKENVVDVIIEWLDRNKPDLVGMMKRKHGLFKDVFRASASKRIAERLTTPFLYYQEE